MSNSQPKISYRAQSAQASPIRKLIPLADEAKKRGTKVYHLNIGQPDLETPREFFDAIKNFKDRTIEYAHSGGIKECVSAWKKYYKDWNINAEEKDILVTTGGSEAIVFAMSIITDPGDEIIVFEPFYTNYNGFSSLVGCKLVPIKTSVENGFKLPKKEIIEEKITERTKGIIICNPNNPTGTVYTKEELQILTNIAKEHNIFILSDETYREFVFNGQGRAVSMMDFPEISQNVIILDSISKRFSACGVRIGCIVSKNEKVMESALKFGQARLSVATLEQLSVIPVLENSKKIIPPIVAEYKKRRDIVYGKLQQIKGVTCLKPEGALYTLPKIPVKDSENFAAWLLKEYSKDGKTVMIAPAPGFYATQGLGKDEIRIAYVLNVNDLKDAMELLKDSLEKYKRN